ncbi:MAG: lipopolysaccharide heptosyltransferase II, partial [Deltaproteobacteria bacterium]|nr:lipopolysaccharide heptosyltransferase II [Deltaproteobacteria bacterium]
TILLQNAFSAALAPFLARLPQRQGYARNGRGPLLSRAVPIDPRSRLAHETFYYLDLLAKLGFPAPYSAPRLDLNKAQNLPNPLDLKSLPPLPPGFALALAPGAAYGEAKRYPAKDFAQIARELAKSLDLAVVIVGGPAEREAAQETLAALGPDIKALNLAGQTTLTQAMAILAQCEALVANDSGLAHLAGALNKPVVVLFGPTNPLTTGPLASRRLVLREPVPCAPCRHRVCPRAERICFQGLRPTRVAQKILEFLGQSPVQGRPALFWADQPPPDPQNPKPGRPLADPALLTIAYEPQAGYEVFGQKAQNLGLDLRASFWMAEDPDFLALGRRLGGRTIFLANADKPANFQAALNLPPDLAAPSPRRALEWLQEQLAD